MPRFRQTPKFILRLIRIPPQIAYTIGLGPLIGKLILLLITTGRKTGKKRVTPLLGRDIIHPIICFWGSLGLGV
jgi:hypothetical protein